MNIKKGQKLGEIGITGAVTGPHLHYEIRNRSGKVLNPRKANLGLRNAPKVEEIRYKKKE